MANDSDDAASDAPKASSAGVKKTLRKPRIIASREQSSIVFPYQDLDTAVSVALAIFGAGGIALSREQLAGVMGLAIGSGNFVTKVATARIFGLITYTQGRYELTDLGFEICESDEKRQRAARARAFLNVPLYKRAYDEFRGKQLPPRPLGLEQAFMKFGVAPKQKTNARLAFDKSAKQAGFFSNGPDRLIEPIIGATSATDRVRPTVDSIDNNQDGERDAAETSGPDMTGFHPFIQGLLDTLPEPGTNWTIEGRTKWLQAAANIFDLIYKGSGEIRIMGKPEAHSDE